STAGKAGAIVSTMPADTHALPLAPSGNALAYFVYEADHFVSWNARILNAGPGAFFGDDVTMADTAGLHLDAHLSRTGVRDGALDDLEIGSGSPNLRCLHGCSRN